MTTLHATAGYLPGLAPADVQWQALRFESGPSRLEVAVPVLRPQQMSALALRVGQASRRHLKTMTVSAIVEVVDRAMARLLDSADPYRRELDQLLPIVTGYDAEMVRLGLTAFFKTFRAPQLHRFVAEDFSNPKLLDEFQPRLQDVELPDVRRRTAVPAAPRAVVVVVVSAAALLEHARAGPRPGEEIGEIRHRPEHSIGSAGLTRRARSCHPGRRRDVERPVATMAVRGGSLTTSRAGAAPSGARD